MMVVVVCWVVQVGRFVDIDWSLYVFCLLCSCFLGVSMNVVGAV